MKIAKTGKPADAGGKYIEVQAKTVQDAIKQALIELNAKANEVKIEVLSVEHRGLFGMEGSDPAKIRVTLLKVR